MEVKELYSQKEASGNEESTLLQDPYEEEEALSLSDLPIYSQWDDFSKEDEQSTPTNNYNDEDDFFEFFSEDFTSSTTSATAENIIFCGKIIPFKEPPQIPQKGQTFDSRTKQSNAQMGVLHPRRPKSFGKAKPTLETVKSCNSSSKKGREVRGSKDLMSAYSIGKVSLLRSTTKSRWYLFMFGMSSRSSTEMELKDIRNRQSQRGPAVMFPVPKHGEVVKSKRRRNGKGLWRMLRSLGFGCSCNHINDVAEASFI